MWPCAARTTPGGGERQQYTLCQIRLHETILNIEDETYMFYKDTRAIVHYFNNEATILVILTMINLGHYLVSSKCYVSRTLLQYIFDCIK